MCKNDIQQIDSNEVMQTIWTNQGIILNLNDEEKLFFEGDYGELESIVNFETIAEAYIENNNNFAINKIFITLKDSRQAILQVI